MDGKQEHHRAAAAGKVDEIESMPARARKFRLQRFPMEKKNDCNYAGAEAD